MSGLREKMWLIIAVFLLMSLAAGAIFFSIRLARLQPVEITLDNSRQAEVSGDIYISGAVTRPGIYQVGGDYMLSTLVSTAGPSDNADIGHIVIYVPSKSEAAQPQKVNINRAEPWLLQALPGIGEGKASLIVGYRSKNGPFRSLDDLLKIEGFGQSMVDKIRNYATVVD